MDQTVKLHPTRYWEYRIVRAKNPCPEAISPNGLESVPYFYNICMVIFENDKVVVIDKNPVKLSSYNCNMDLFIQIIKEAKKLPIIDTETFDFV